MDCPFIFRCAMVEENEKPTKDKKIIITYLLREWVQWGFVAWWIRSLIKVTTWIVWIFAKPSPE